MKVKLKDRQSIIKTYNNSFEIKFKLYNVNNKKDLINHIFLFSNGENLSKKNYIKSKYINEKKTLKYKFMEKNL